MLVATALFDLPLAPRLDAIRNDRAVAQA